MNRTRAASLGENVECNSDSDAHMIAADVKGTAWAIEIWLAARRVASVGAMDKRSRSGRS